MAIKSRTGCETSCPTCYARGHHVPEATIIRRYFAGIKNLINVYLPFVDTAIIIDASSENLGLLREKTVIVP